VRTVPPTADAADLCVLAAAAAAGDEDAWQTLWQRVEPRLLRLVANPGLLGRLGSQPDDRLNIVVEVMARLRAHDFDRLKRFLAARRDNPDLELMTWLRVVTKRVGIDYMRAHPDYLDQRRAPGDSPGVWVIPTTLPPASEIDGGRPPVTADGTAHQIAAFAAGVLSTEQHRALELWVQGIEAATIASALGLADAAEATRAVRAAIDRLRRHFREGAS